MTRTLRASRERTGLVLAVCVAVGSVALASANVARAEAPPPSSSGLPVRLSIEAARREIGAGEAWTCRVRLKGIFGQIVTAAAPTAVSVDVGQSEPRKLTIPSGASDVEATWTFPVPGFHVIHARADGMVDAAMPLVVRPAALREGEPLPKRYGVPNPEPKVAPDKPLPAGKLIESLPRMLPMVRPVPTKPTGSSTATTPPPSAEATAPPIAAAPPPIVAPAPAPAPVVAPAPPESAKGDRLTTGKTGKSGKLGKNAQGGGSHAASGSASGAVTAHGKGGLGSIGGTTSGSEAAAGASSGASGAAKPEHALGLYVVPEHVQALGDGWTAELAIVAQGPDSAPSPVAEPVQVRLAAGLGKLTPSAVTIPRGDTLPADRILIHSDRPGTDQVSAFSSFGVFQSPKIEYATAPAARLRVDANPPRTINSGRSPVTVTVLLLDGQNRPTASAGDVEVVLTSTLGDLAPPSLTIKAGDFAAQAELTSPVSGTAVITARASGMSDATATVLFEFPLRLVVLASLGGLLGATVRSRRRLARGHIGRALVVNLALGAALGFVFFVLAMFGAVGALPKLALPVEKIPSVNELGAFVLGVLGGWLGRRFLPKLSGGDSDSDGGGEGEGEAKAKGNKRAARRPGVVVPPPAGTENAPSVPGPPR